jgi:TolB-like protein
MRMERLTEFIRELQARKVFRVASVYVVVLWILVQGAIDLFPVFGLPDWSIRLLVVIGVVGFPIAVLLAWVFQFTSRGLVRDTDSQVRERARSGNRHLDFIVIGAGVVLVGFLLLRANVTQIVEEGLVTPDDPPSAPMATADNEPFEPHPQSIAVLPFVNMSSDPDTGYFGDGMTEELLNVLANIPGLRVASRTSAFSFKDTTADIPTVSRQLDVAYVLEGSVRKSGNQVRITAQLIDGREDVHLYSETWDRELLDLFSVQDEISAVIVDTLKPTLLAARNVAPPAGRTTDSAQAYELYLRGRAAAQPGTPEALDTAREHLEASIELDPGFARAHGALARILTEQAENAADPTTLLERAREEARVAVRLDNSLREAHEVLNSR